jgi:hypothetical protein
MALLALAPLSAMSELPATALVTSAEPRRNPRLDSSLAIMVSPYRECLMHGIDGCKLALKGRFVVLVL